MWPFRPLNSIKMAVANIEPYLNFTSELLAFMWPTAGWLLSSPLSFSDFISSLLTQVAGLAAWWLPHIEQNDVQLWSSMTIAPLDPDHLRENPPRAFLLWWSVESVRVCCCHHTGISSSSQPWWFQVIGLLLASVTEHLNSSVLDDCRHAPNMQKKFIPMTITWETWVWPFLFY